MIWLGITGSKVSCESQRRAGRPTGGEWAGEGRAHRNTWMQAGWPGTMTGHPSLAGTKGQMGKSSQGEQKSGPIYYQHQVTRWGCVTAIKIKPREGPVARPDPCGGFLKFPPDEGLLITLCPWPGGEALDVVKRLQLRA